MNISTIAISDVIISDDFKKTTPKEYKINRIREYVHRYGKIDKPIVLMKDNVLFDGYTRYIVAKELGVQEVPYIEFDRYFKKATAPKYRKYIAGRFENGKEYFWKICNKKLDVNVGDKVLVANKNGRAIVSVVSVFESNDKKMRKHKPVLKVIESKKLILHN